MTAPTDQEEPRIERRSGAGMIIAAWLLILGLLAIPFSGLLEDKHNPNRNVEGARLSDGSAEVTLLRNRQGHYVAPGLINGRPVSFMLDTGATVVSVPETMARDIGLTRGRPVTLETANGTRRAWATRLDRVELGTIRLDNIPAVINPGHGTPQVLLGMSFLKQLEFTQRGRELTLRQN